jgi:hypothetical protein
MNIKITFSGLCCFVPRTTPDGTTMNVLLPQTPVPSENGFPEVPNHIAQIYQNDQPLSPLVGKQLQIITPGHAPNASGELKQGVADLTALYGNHVKPHLLGTAPGDDLRARVLLPGGEMVPSPQQLHWRVGNHSGVLMTFVVQWRFPNAPDNTLIQVSDFDGGNASTLPASPDEHGTVTFIIDHHVDPLGDFGTHVPCGFESAHFRAFHKLLIGGDSLPLPSLEDCDGLPLWFEPHSKHRHIFTIDPTHETADDFMVSPNIYTCLVAGAQP